MIVMQAVNSQLTMMSFLENNPEDLFFVLFLLSVLNHINLVDLIG